MKKYGLFSDYSCIKHFENEFNEHIILNFSYENLNQDIRLLEKAINEYKKNGGKRNVDIILEKAKLKLHHRKEYDELMKFLNIKGE